ncbi:hypothetical protein IHC87_16090 [Photobacterium damselae subsp. damselae]|uniref:hypothetical protein n=1 Tax=Photobacterium damselae TaxID=38293 RepID=UPI001F442CB4|nr:hypothetical protein [Photobacterium damselae]UJZ96092.1 hypothetical protein IHC87_16090 [Photobacterium damselae subsp. damselae]UKA00004.1 hypothetical protein IHC88_15565 [Photobacterium damselae subsp. damselae]
MEPTVLAGGFATIIGLICNFKSERRATSDDEFKEFMLWLESKRHKQTITEINSNHLLGLGIKSLLSENHDAVMKQLSILDESMMQLASQINGFKNISSAINPNIELSQQAISVIRQIDKSGGSSIIDVTCNQTSFIIMDATGSIEISEPRFIEDDLGQLVKLGFLIPDRGSKGSRIFRITRSAIKYLGVSN